MAEIRVSINNQKRDVVRTVGITPQLPANSLKALQDVDTSKASNNAVLVYNEQTNNYVIQELPGVNGGNF